MNGPENRALAALSDRAAAQLMRLPGVTGVGLGGRTRGGRATGELVLQVFVERKRPPEELAPGEMLPTAFEGVGIDVVPLGYDEEFNTPAPPDTATPAAFPGAPFMPDTAGDDARERPLLAGPQVQCDLPGAGGGTLGCIVLHRTDPNLVYALTNFHVVSADDNRTRPVLGTTRVGQPLAKDSPTKCCSDMFGTVVAGDRDNVMDAALIQIDAGMEYFKDIKEIGLISGTHTPDATEVANHDYFVLKYGVATHATGGYILSVNATRTTADGITRNNVTVIAPNPNAAVPAGERTYFADHGDSGAVVLDLQGRAVALIFGGAKVDTATEHTMTGAGLPIEQTLTLFRTPAGTPLPVTIATGTTPRLKFTVPGATTVALPAELVPALTGRPAGEVVRVPVEAPWLPSTPIPSPLLQARLEHSLDASPAGRRLISLWLRHSDELITLLEERRRVAVVWHRSGGPALLQLFIRMAADPGLAFPRTINGRPIGEAMDRIAAAFGAYASPGLRTALAEARAVLPDLAGLTFAGLLGELEGSHR